MRAQTGFILVVALSLAIPCPGLASTNPDLTREGVKAEVQKHFANPDPKSGLVFTESVPGSGELADRVNAFFKENFLYVDWMTRQATDSIQSLIDSACAFIETRGLRVSGFTMPFKKQMTMAELKVIAVRNIFPMRLSPGGKIGTLICASAMGFNDFPERNIPAEAFAFQTVFEEIKGEESFIMARVRDYGQLAASLKLSTNSDDLVKRAQGVYWVLLYQDPEFGRLLLTAYRDKAKILPFEIANE